MAVTDEQQKEFNRVLLRLLRSNPEARKNAETYLGKQITDKALDSFEKEDC